MYGYLPNLTMCAEDRGKWYFIVMGDIFEIHPICLHGQILISWNHKKDTITVFPPSMEDVKGHGEWMLVQYMVGICYSYIIHSRVREIPGLQPIINASSSK